MLYDLGVFAVALDAACLGWGTSWLAERFSASAPVLQRFSEGVIFGALFLCIAALSVSTVHLMLRLLRITSPLSVLDRQPYAVYAAKIHFALASGLFFGREIRQDDPQRVGSVLMNFFLVLILFKGYSLIVTGLKPKVRWRGPWPWNEAANFSALFLLMILSGLGGPLELLSRGLALLAPHLAASGHAARPMACPFAPPTLLEERCPGPLPPPLAEAGHRDPVALRDPTLRSSRDSMVYLHPRSTLARGFGSLDESLRRSDGGR